MSCNPLPPICNQNGVTCQLRLAPVRTDQCGNTIAFRQVVVANVPARTIPCPPNTTVTVGRKRK